MSTWNPWKATAIGMALVMSIALITGLVVANYAGSDRDRKSEAKSPAKPPARTASNQNISQPTTSMVPTQAAVDACNQWAAQQTVPQDKTMEAVKDGAVGAAGGAVTGGGKGAAIGGVVGAGGGALYGPHGECKHGERLRAGCAAGPARPPHTG